MERYERARIGVLVTVAGLCAHVSRETSVSVRGSGGRFSIPGAFCGVAALCSHPYTRIVRRMADFLGAAGVLFGLMLILMALSALPGAAWALIAVGGVMFAAGLAHQR